MAITLYAGLLFIRGLVDWVGPFRANIMAEAINKGTDPAVTVFQILFRKNSPLPGILAMVLLILLKWMFIAKLGMFSSLVPILIVFKEVWEIVFQVLFWWILAYVILSWIGFPPHPAVEVLVKVASGLLRPIRRLIPSFGGIDFSPIVLIVGIQIIGQLIMKLLQQLVL